MLPDCTVALATQHVTLNQWKCLFVGEIIYQFYIRGENLIAQIFYKSIWLLLFDLVIKPLNATTFSSKV